jgi:hypothetical protein
VLLHLFRELLSIDFDGSAARDGMQQSVIGLGHHDWLFEQVVARFARLDRRLAPVGRLPAP